MYQFLKKDIYGLELKLVELGQQLLKVNADAANWTRQSSETWHDNFGFEEGERQKRALITRMDQFRALKNSSVMVTLPDGDRVEVGTVVTFVDERGVERKFAVSSYMVFDKIFDYEISYATPLIAPLISHAIGDEAEVGVGSRRQVVEIIEISVATELFRS